MVQCNATLEYLTVKSEVAYSFGITFHSLGLDISGAFGIVSIIIADYLIIQHARHYLVPEEQKHIIRILLMLPIYSTVSFLSYYFYEHAIYFDVLRDCYEAFAIASFFTLLCNYVAPNLHAQKEYFRKEKVKNWIPPINWLQRCTGGAEHGWLRKPSSGLTWFNIVYVCVFQYCFIRVVFTLVSVITEYYGRYCQSSNNPAFAHIWVLCFEGLSVTIAMYGLIQFYVQLRHDIAAHKPFLKIACIKLVIFFSFWQTLVISFLTSQNVIRESAHLAYPDISVGLPSMLLCIEMAFFAVLHIFAFPWKVYSLKHISVKDTDSAVNFPGSGYSGTPHYKGGPLGMKALLESFNPWDIIKASARGFKWLFVGARHRKEDSSYQREEGVEPFGTELRDRVQPEVPIVQEPFQAPTGMDGNGYTVSGLRGGQVSSDEDTAYTRPNYPVDEAPVAMPHMPGEHPHPARYPHSRTTTVQSWRTGDDDDDAWGTSVGPEEDSARPSFEYEGREGLLRNAVAPGATGRIP